jgi:hypothetical protein
LVAKPTLCTAASEFQTSVISWHRELPDFGALFVCSPVMQSGNTARQSASGLQNTAVFCHFFTLRDTF